MLLALAGLPGTGKSTLAACLVRDLGAIVLDKDRVRAVLFPPAVIDYSTTQDDLCMDALYRATLLILRADPRRLVVIDGRTFLRPGQMDALLDLGQQLGEQPRVIECVCAEAVARQRLEEAEGRHPAGNRNFALYQTLKVAAVPLTVPRLVLDTGELSPGECVQRCREYLRTDTR
jgi:adenylylsulfate kinase